jgi:hypothetical protein
MLGIDRAIDRPSEDHAAAFLETDEGLAPGRGLGTEIGAGDRHQPPAVGETRQRRGDMAIGCVGHSAVDVCNCGEWRVHQHDARRDRSVEMILDLRRIEARDGDAGKEVLEECGASVRQFVQHECAAGDLGQDGEEPGAGRRLEHAVGGRNGGRGAGREAERDRRRELLERLALLRTARVGGQKAGDLCERNEP